VSTSGLKKVDRRSLNGRRHGAAFAVIISGMFTGLVEEVSVVQAIKRAGPGVRLQLKAAALAKDAKIGDSIAVNGCCLTVVARERSLLSFEAGEETLNRTNLGRLKKGSRVNLEGSLKLGDRLGGHLVTGHIDGTATLIKRRDDEDWSHFTFRVPLRLSRQMASKGSVAVDGVSLTLVTVENDSFSVALIPHTLTHTTLADMEIGELVNIETDILAKYVERQLDLLKASPAAR
jgi:riboflavin synthase